MQYEHSKSLMTLGKKAWLRASNYNSSQNLDSKLKSKWHKQEIRTHFLENHHQFDSKLLMFLELFERRANSTSFISCIPLLSCVDDEFSNDEFLTIDPNLQRLISCERVSPILQFMKQFDQLKRSSLTKDQF